jgi:hypothetical protein
VRPKLAVFLAVAVVFAPGWGGHQLAGGERPSAEVGARMLAPTFEEATDRGSSVLKRLDRSSPIGKSNKLVWWVTSPTPIIPFLGPLLAALIAIALISATEALRSRSERAPPLLLTV